MSAETRTKLWSFFQCLFDGELNAEKEKAAQPAWIKTPLLDHQRSAVHAALDLEKAKEGTDVGALPGEVHGGRLFTTYGILGDRVGAGKSLIALSLIKQPPPPAHYMEYSWRACGSADNAVGLLRRRDQTQSLSDTQPLRHLSASLFIVPHALIGQWRDYVTHDTVGSELRCTFITKRKEATDPELFAKLDTFDAVFVSATMWRDFEVQNNMYSLLWNRLFIDEADTVQVSLPSDRVHARFVWLISASWMNLVFAGGAFLNLRGSHMPPVNTPSPVIQRMSRFIAGEFFNVEGARNPYIRKLCGNYSASGYSISSLNPVIYQSTRLLIHNDEDYIRSSFHIPPVHHLRYLCLTPPNIQVLKNVISAEMMERLHAGDAEGVLGMLGMSMKTAEDITAAVTESIQKELDGVRRLYDFKKTVEYATESAKVKALEHLEEKMARLQSRIDAIQDRLKNTGDQQCPICFCEIEKPSLTPCCRNLFCFGCICEVMKRTCICPLCRETIPNIQAIQVIGSETKEDECNKVDKAKEEPKLLTKQEQFRLFLQQNPTARVLMFSGYDATFGGLSSVLEVDGIPHATLHGSQARIAKLIRDFEAGKYRVLFLNARNMGAGLNIMPATHVVLYHRMSAEMQKQIVGRAMRMGRKDSLTVVHLLHGNEMTNEEGSEETGTIQHV